MRYQNAPVFAAGHEIAPFLAVRVSGAAGSAPGSGHVVSAKG